VDESGRGDPALSTRRAAIAELGDALRELVGQASATERYAREDMTLHGVTILKGDLVLAVIASANRDELFWGADADEVKLSRDNAHHHVSFGAGPHHCLGASLARLEASIAFARLTARFTGLALDGDVTWNGRINLRGPARLPVSVR